MKTFMDKYARLKQAKNYDAVFLSHSFVQANRVTAALADCANPTDINGLEKLLHETQLLVSSLQNLDGILYVTQKSQEQFYTLLKHVERSLDWYQECEQVAKRNLKGETRRNKRRVVKMRRTQLDENQSSPNTRPRNNNAKNYLNHLSMHLSQVVKSLTPYQRRLLIPDEERISKKAEYSLVEHALGFSMVNLDTSITILSGHEETYKALEWEVLKLIEKVMSIPKTKPFQS